MKDIEVGDESSMIAQQIVQIMQAAEYADGGDFVWGLLETLLDRLPKADRVYALGFVQRALSDEDEIEVFEWPNGRGGGQGDG